MNYQETLNYLTGKGNHGIKPGLERIKILLDKLGRPQEGIFYVHVTGTNGKGSVTSMLTSIFEASGLKVGKFTSPHLEKWNERINICGRDVTDEEFGEAVGAVAQAAKEAGEELEEPSQFELVTAAAFRLFQKAGIAAAVLEVGMGGRWDATNVITPECSVITNVAIDHIEYLGETIENVAQEKAGIIKPGVPVVTAAESVALNTLIDKAASLRCPIHIFRSDFTAIGLGGDLTQQRFIFRSGDFVANFKLALGGDHQVTNAALAVMAARLLCAKHPEITVASMQKGLETVKWPGRLELYSKAPCVILDGAHNLSGAIALRAALNKYCPGKRISFVLGIMKDKDIKGIVEELVGEEDSLIAVPADSSARAASPDEIVKYSRGKNSVADDLENALRQAEADAGEDGAVCIAGSLYLAGQAKSIWKSQSARGDAAP
ncbi:MAG: bifunctional folylpolyglutamate synthase/dihydrofolate synthase [Acidaminococcales bacterium]|jgi:dihydrofolate synthase/folylpolyglutamate synthase|nr:bifunctional folylpolyglutamate synthase/dihydrofolate synthase [Acidaminococcales bacterium]